MGMAAVLMYGPLYFQPPFNTRHHMKCEDIWPRGFRGEVVQRCERTDGE